MISESQERMTLAVPPSCKKEFFELAKDRGVSVQILGDFNDSGFLEVYFGELLLGKFNLNFLHKGLPSMDLKAIWDGPRKRKEWLPVKKEYLSFHYSKVMDILPQLLHRANIASKWYWVSQYDHEVQGSTVVKPFVGKKQKVPSDSGVVDLEIHGGIGGNGVAIGCGLAPRIGLHDPYLMAQYSVDEAVRNVLASGGNPQKLCLLDNFCWPNPIASLKNKDGEYKLGQLVRTCHGLYDICKAYGAPLVSGKDSMKNDFRGKNKRGEPLTISILPTLLVTSMAQINTNRTVTSEFQRPGDIVYLLEDSKEGSLLASELAEMIKLSKESLISLEPLNLKEFKRIYKCLFEYIQEGKVQSCHDVSDGGLLCALSEGLFNGGLGLNLKIKEKLSFEHSKLAFLFNERPGRFIVSVDSSDCAKFEQFFKGLPLLKLGEVTDSEYLDLDFNGEKENWKVEDLYKAWDRKW